MEEDFRLTPFKLSGMRTLLMIKPDAVEKKVVGKIISMVEERGFDIRDMRMKRFTRDEAEKFYEVHRGKPFFEELVQFITSGPVVGLCLEGEDIVNKVRNFIGATDPSKADPCTVRALYGTNISRNAVHASDSPENAERELKFFFENC